MHAIPADLIVQVPTSIKTSREALVSVHLFNPSIMTASQHIEKSTPAGDAGSKRKLTETRDPIDGQRESSIGGASQCDGEEHVNPNKKPKLLPPRSSSGHHRDADLSPTLLGENSKRSKGSFYSKHYMESWAEYIMEMYLH